MRAEIQIKTIKQRRKLGWFRSEEYELYNVHPNIQLTNEEKQICNRLHLWNKEAFRRTANIDHLEAEMRESLSDEDLTRRYSLQEIVQPDFYIGVNDILEAEDLARQFEEEILPTIKQYLTQASNPIGGRRIVDL